MIVLLQEQIEQLMEFSANPKQRIRTGLHGVDEMCGGPAPGEVFMVLGRSFAGKSIVGQNIVVNNPGVPSIFFSLEMPYITALQRMYAMWSGTPHREVVDRTEANNLPPHIMNMTEQFYNHCIVDVPGLSLNDLSRYVREFEDRVQERPEFVVIDYLEILAGVKTRGEGLAGTEAVAAGLKDWAKSEKMPVFVLHQTNRVEPRYKAPTEDSARNAGYTESDFVVGIYQRWRDPNMQYVEMMGEKNKLRMNVLKNRAYGTTTGGDKDFKFTLGSDLMLKWEGESVND